MTMEIDVSGIKIDDQKIYNNLEEIIEDINNKNGIVKSIKADGKEIMNKKIEPEFLNSINKLEIEAERVTNLLEEGFQEAEKYLPKLMTGLKKIVDKFENNNELEAYQSLETVLEGFKWLDLLLINCKRNLTELEVIDKKKFDQILNQWKLNIGSINKALAEEDEILICDELEYNMIPVLEKIYELTLKINKK